MAVSGPGDPGRIFISYRRDDAGYPAGWLFDLLADQFGKDRVFKDVDSIELGDDFADVINDAVGSCAVLLAMMGPRWLAVGGERGQRRLDDPGDFVRLEIEAALGRDVRVIPVLVEGAVMPQSSQLPESLRGLARRQALELRHSHFRSDCGRLIRVLDKTLNAHGPGPDRLAEDNGHLPPGGSTNAAKTADRPAHVPSELLRELPSSPEGALDLAFHPDGKLLVSAEFDATVRLWEVATGRSLHWLRGHTDTVRSVAFSPDGALLASAGDDTTIRLWSTASWFHERTLTGHTDYVYSVAFSPDGSWLASGGFDGRIILWNVAAGSTVRTLMGGNVDPHIYRVAFSPDALLLAATGLRDELRCWETATGNEVLTAAGYVDVTKHFAFSPDGALLAVSPGNGDVHLLNPATWARERELAGRADAIFTMAFSPDGGLLAAAGGDEEISLWEVATGNKAGALLDPGGSMHKVAFSPDGRVLAAAAGTTIRLWG